MTTNSTIDTRKYVIYILSCVNRGIRCHSLSFVVIRGDSLSIVAFRVSFVVIVSQFVVFRVSFVV